MANKWFYALCFIGQTTALPPGLLTKQSLDIGPSCSNYFETKAHLKLSCLSVLPFGLFLMNLILYGYSFPFTYGSLGQTPALPRPPLDPTKCKSVIPCAFTRSLNVSLFFQMDNFLQGLPTLNLTKWITDEPFLKRIPEPAFPTQVFKHYCVFWRNTSKPWYSPHTEFNN